MLEEPGIAMMMTRLPQRIYVYSMQGSIELSHCSTEISNVALYFVLLSLTRAKSPYSSGSYVVAPDPSYGNMSVYAHTAYPEVSPANKNG